MNVRAVLQLFCIAILSLQPLPSSTKTSNNISELLSPEVAFLTTVEVLDSNTLRVNYTIAEGYYLYNNKFRFQSQTEGVSLGIPDIPSGVIKQDEFFGEVETQRGALSIVLPYSAAPSIAVFKLQAISQGCADLGVCYPPYKVLLDVELPNTTDSNRAAGSNWRSNPLSSLLSLAGFNNNDPLLSAEQAFDIELLPMLDNQLPVVLTIADGYYLYRDKLKFTLDGATIGDVQLPPGVAQSDEFYGQTQVYRHRQRINLPIENLRVATDEAYLVVDYQGCADVGVCYPPQNQRIPVNLTPQTNVSPPTPSEQDLIAASIADNSLPWVILIFMGLGLLLAFTPCTLPMMPILSSLIIGQGGKIGTRRAFGLSLTYVMAMAITYAAAGVIVGLSGNNIQVWLQTPWVLIGFASILVGLSLSMFGFYTLQMPAVLQSRLSAWSNAQQGGSVLGAVLMGLLSALIVGPCITAPLVGALIYIANTGDALLGGFALFSLAMGMGIPLLLIGTSAGALLPRADAWMQNVKTAFGVILLALAIWMLARLLPLAVTMALAAALMICTAIYMRALDSLEATASGWSRLGKGLGVLLLLYGCLLAIGAGSGSGSFIYPLKGLVDVQGFAVKPARLPFVSVKGLQGLERALNEARATQTPVMLDFYADWCISCKEMEAFTLADPKVQAALEGTAWLKTDVTANDTLDRELLKQFGLFGPPAILFFDRQGQEIEGSRVVGYKSADEFLTHINRTFGSL